MESSRIPPGQQLVAPGKWPIIGEQRPSDSARPWSLTLSGLVTTPREFSPTDLQLLPITCRQIDIHCVTRWSRLDTVFRGVLLADLLAVVQPLTTARYVSFQSRSARGHSTSLELATALELGTLVAWECDDQPLSLEHGGPIRNIVPRRYFYKSVKWLERIELLADDRLGYWEAESGYHNEADPWQEQRYMAPNLDKRAAATLISQRDFSGQDLRSIDCSHRDLRGLKAQQAWLRDGNFRGADLTQADFSQANLSNAHFENACLEGVSFVGADLEGANLAGANLQGADFRNASLFGCSFVDELAPGEIRGAKLSADTWIPAELRNALTPEQWEFLEQSPARRQ